MEIGLIGLGRMGHNIARRLLTRGNHKVAVFDRDPNAVAMLGQHGATCCSSLFEMLQTLARPRIVWIMLPAGAATEETISALASAMAEGDTVIDGGNTFWQDDLRRAQFLYASGIHYVDVGTSGGIWGLERGYCLMIGGEEDVVERLDPIFSTLAPGVGAAMPTPNRRTEDNRAERGYIHAGPHGAGHFVKMVHNGIEYGLMQAYAEGFDVLRSAGTDAIPEQHRFQFNVADIAEVWRRGSVITSWLLDLSATAFAGDPELAAYSGHVEDSGEARWIVKAALDEAVPVDVITAALFARFRTRQRHTFAGKVLSAMRHGFGGHVEAPRTAEPGST